jgi:hypothetical protein
MKMVTSDTQGNHYLLIQPLKVIYALMEKPGMVALNLISWVFPKITEKQEFIIYPKDIITLAEPTVGIKKYYNEMIKEIQYDTSVGGNGLDLSAFDTGDADEDEDSYIKQVMDELKENKRRLH